LHSLPSGAFQIAFPVEDQTLITPVFRLAWLFLSALFLALNSAGPVSVLAETGTREARRGVEIQPQIAEGLPISLVYIHLEKSTGDPARDEDLKEQAAKAFSLHQGEPFRPIVEDMGLKRVRQVDSVQSAEYKVYAAVPSGQIVVVIFVTPYLEKMEVPKKPSGVLASREIRDFPTVFEDDRSKYVFILNGGAGIYSDTNPWFGGYGDLFNKNSPIAKDPLGPGTSTWVEGYLEPGLGGITQIGNYPLYTYGAATYLLSGTHGHDIYNSGNWGHGEVEKLYGGFIYDLPGKGNVFDFSIGKQIYQLRDGFLLSKIPVSTQVGERAALYLGPRLASKNTILGRLRAFGFGLDAFVIEPSEPEVIETDTRLLGINLQRKFRNIDAAFTYFYIANSDSVYPTPDGQKLPREGLRTFNPSLSMTNLFGLDGSWIKAEYAYQNHEDVDMAAQAGYVWVGYQAEKYSWRPALSYRWSMFTGDNPDTQTFERFDPLFSGGLGNFLPGIIFSKVYKNANLITNRATFSVQPSDTLELILDYFHHRADELNNLGGIGPLQTLQSRDVGQEVTLTVFHYFGRNFFFQGIASVGIPGEAIEQAVGGSAKNWYTLQASLYMFF
jgi:hypothetical protein